MKRVLMAAVACAMLAGCTDAQWKRQTAYNNPHRIEMYSGGQKVGTWTSTGAPRSVADEDGWQFVDRETKEFITVTGDVVITQLPE